MLTRENLKIPSSFGAAFHFYIFSIDLSWPPTQAHLYHPHLTPPTETCVCVCSRKRERERRRCVQNTFKNQVAIIIITRTKTGERLPTIQQQKLPLLCESISLSQRLRWPFFLHQRGFNELQTQRRESSRLIDGRQLKPNESHCGKAATAIHHPSTSH